MVQARPARMRGSRRLVVTPPAGLTLGATVLGLPLRHPGPPSRVALARPAGVWPGVP